MQEGARAGPGQNPSRSFPLKFLLRGLLEERPSLLFLFSGCGEGLGQSHLKLDPKFTRRHMSQVWTGLGCQNCQVRDKWTLKLRAVELRALRGQGTGGIQDQRMGECMYAWPEAPSIRDAGKREYPHKPVPRAARARQRLSRRGVGTDSRESDARHLKAKELASLSSEHMRGQGETPCLPTLQATQPLRPAPFPRIALSLPCHLVLKPVAAIVSTCVPGCFAQAPTWFRPFLVPHWP